MLVGNYHRIFRDAREYILSLHENYGGAVKIHAFLEVSFRFILLKNLQTACLPQSKQLLVSDPLALHHIVVKEQDVYTETDMFIMYVTGRFGLKCLCF